MRILPAFLLLLVLSSCGQQQIPKEKFYRGNIVSTKLDKRIGTIIGKQYVYNDRVAHDVWRYDVRFPNNTVGATSAYASVSMYEWELEPGPAEH